MAYENYFIKDFMDAWFDQKYEVLSKEDFQIVHAEYLDTSGLFLSEDFEKKSYINHLSQRINYVKIFVMLQRDFIKEFDMPFVRDFERLKFEYGYVLKWKENKDDFENQLKRIELREIKHNSILEEKIKELNNSRANNHKKEKDDEDDVSLKKSRISFIRMLNSLGKIGYNIDKLKTTVEELAIMIKQQTEEVRDLKSNQ